MMIVYSGHCSDSLCYVDEGKIDRYKIDRLDMYRWIKRLLRVLKVSLRNLCFNCVQLANGGRGHGTQHMRGSTVHKQNKNNSLESETNTEWSKSRWLGRMIDQDSAYFKRAVDVQNLGLYTSKFWQ